MIHATRFVAGVALKNIGAGLVTVTLTQVEGGSRARAAARFMVDVQHASMGDGERVRFIDARGYPEALQLGQVVQWLSKHMSGGAVSVRINVTDATRLPAPWTPSRINAMAAKFAAVDPDALRDDAAAKVATVTSWADSGRRAAVLDAAARMGECAAFVEWVRGERAEWPGAGDGVIEPPPPPPAPAPEPPAPAPEPPPPPPPPPPPAPMAPMARAALRVSQPATVHMTAAVPVGVLVVGGERLAGTLSSNEKVLWYSLDVGADQWIALETHGAAGVDTVLAIYSQSGQVLGVNNNGAGLLSRLTLNDPNENTADNVTVPAGSYLVGVALNPVTFGHDWDVAPGDVQESKEFEISAVALQVAPPTPIEPPTADYVLTPELMGTLSNDFHHIGDGWQTFTIGLELHHMMVWGESRPVLMHPDVNYRGSTGKMLTLLCAPVEVESVTMSIAPRSSAFAFDTEVFLEVGGESMNAFVAFRLVGDDWRVTAGQTEATGTAGALVDAVTFWPKTGAVRLHFVGGDSQDIASVQLPENQVSAIRVNLSAGAIAGLQVERAQAPEEPPPPALPTLAGALVVGGEALAGALSVEAPVQWYSLTVPEGVDSAHIKAICDDEETALSMGIYSTATGYQINGEWGGSGWNETSIYRGPGDYVVGIAAPGAEFVDGYEVVNNEPAAHGYTLGVVEVGGETEPPPPPPPPPPPGPQAVPMPTDWPDGGYGEIGTPGEFDDLMAGGIAWASVTGAARGASGIVPAVEGDPVTLTMQQPEGLPAGLGLQMIGTSVSASGQWCGWPVTLFKGGGNCGVTLNGHAVVLGPQHWNEALSIYIQFMLARDMQSAVVFLNDGSGVQKVYALPISGAPGGDAISLSWNAGEVEFIMLESWAVE